MFTSTNTNDAHPIPVITNQSGRPLPPVIKRPTQLILKKKTVKRINRPVANFVPPTKRLFLRAIKDLQKPPLPVGGRGVRQRLSDSPVLPLALTPSVNAGGQFVVAQREQGVLQQGIINPRGQTVHGTVHSGVPFPSIQRRTEVVSQQFQQHQPHIRPLIITRTQHWRPPPHPYHKSEVNYRFPCYWCGSSFNRKANLRQHIRIHLVVRPYECSHCGAGYAGSAGLKAHLDRSLVCQIRQAEKMNSLIPTSTRLKRSYQDQRQESMDVVSNVLLDICEKTVYSFDSHVERLIMLKDKQAVDDCIRFINQEFSQVSVVPVGNIWEISRVNINHKWRTGEERIDIRSSMKYLSH